LKGISFHLKKGGFYGVVGRVGSGKSALLKAIIGEVPFCKGTVAKKGSVAFVEQEPPMFVGTVRENILFGK
jgi:ABC-type multidrug transport system fused ATPase/permease subunit